ncbi:MAG: ribonuclease J [Candidatus Liptonbacteria bacterium]|nr:ribonuclease J [Candidatus Liptonbacteria bacterium]
MRRPSAIIENGADARPHMERDKDALYFVPLGGLEEIGRNCSYFEYGDEIVVVDFGIQFPEEATPGIDYIIPNVSSLIPKRQKIKAIIFTHGHYDHIAAIHYAVEKLGNPILITSQFTRHMIEKRHEEFTNAPRLRFETVTDGKTVKISNHFSARFFLVDHTIPEALGFMLDTPVGKMVSCGDFRMEIDKHGKPQNTDVFKTVGKEGIHSFFVDATNADYEGFSDSEEAVTENLDMLIKNSRGRVIVGAFASILDRIFEVMKIAEKYGRHVALNGRSMKTNLEIAKNLGYLKWRKEDFIPLEEINKYPDEKVLLLTTGAQGEANAGLMRIVSGEHRFVRLKQDDTVIFSSSVVPGNERSVQFLQDNIARQVDELYNTKLLDIHVSGHGKAEDIKLAMKLVKPRFVVPIHAYYFKRKMVVKHGAAIGMPNGSVMMMDNGQVARLTKDGFEITEEKVDSSYVMVDGLGVGDVGEVVIRDRLVLAQEGMIVIIATISRRTGRILKNPDIISRGFIYLKENQEILNEIRKRMRAIIGRLPENQEADPDYLKKQIRDQIGQYVFNKTRRRPLILPVIIEI